MSTTANSPKWIIVDSNGKRYGKPTYLSEDEAKQELPKLQESSGGSNLYVKQLLLE